MPVFAEDPSHFSKQRLRSELITHNVELPPGESKKQVYVALYLKHIGPKAIADFSSDEEEEEVQNGSVVEEEKKEDQHPDTMDLSSLTDEQLKQKLLQHGVKVGPIVASTRALYEKKLQRLIEPVAQPKLNGTGDAGQYSDSEEEEEVEEEEEEDKEEETTASPEQSGPETVSRTELSSTVGKEPVTNVLMELFPETGTTPTGISATRRRPIKGAAGRPVQFKYPDTPPSPATLERRGIQARIVPIWVQILVFPLLVCLLFLIYALMEIDSDPFTSLFDSFSQEAEEVSKESPLLDGSQDMAVPFPTGEE